MCDHMGDFSKFGHIYRVKKYECQLLYIMSTTLNVYYIEKTELLIGGVWVFLSMHYT